MDHHAVAAVSIAGTCLDVLGSLYLAYDLLGGQHGPLRLLTRAGFTKIRRGKEVAENRQSHCPVAADTIYRTPCGCHISRGPANEF